MEITAAATTRTPAPRWATATARAIPWLGLPVCLWRLPIGFGSTMGMDLPPIAQPLWITVPYVLALSVLSEVFGLLCGALVQPWGETVSPRVPVLRGRRIPPAAVIVPAALAGLALTALSVDWVLTTFGLAGFEDVGWTGPWWQGLAVAVTGLFALWGPLVLALTFAYYRRRCGRPSAGVRPTGPAGLTAA
ncbi:hypothetical protein ACWGB8_27250 [Kitasatospora sp. NPDC054939]